MRKPIHRGNRSLREVSLSPALKGAPGSSPLPSLQPRHCMQTHIPALLLVTAFLKAGSPKLSPDKTSPPQDTSESLNGSPATSLFWPQPA